jgi:hypothetical protein
MNPNMSSAVPWNPQGTYSGFASDSGIERVRTMNQNVRSPMSAGKFSFTGNPQDRAMYEAFATQKGAQYSKATSGSSTYEA